MTKLSLETETLVVHPFRTFRRKKDMTIGELSRKMGKNPATVSRIENGKTPCSRKFAKAFEKISGISWKELVILDHEQFRRPSEPRGR